MKDNLIKSDEIYLQDIVCLNVMKNPNMNNFDLYNQIVEMVDVYDIKNIPKDEVMETSLFINNLYLNNDK